MRWTREEYEVVDSMYDEQYVYKVIADQLNKDFHGGKEIRTVDSISYAIKRLYEDDVLSTFED